MTFVMRSPWRFADQSGTVECVMAAAANITTADA